MGLSASCSERLAEALPGIDELLGFWFGEPPAELERREWFAATPGFDAEIERRFATLHARAAAGGAFAWLDTPRGCLAYTLLFDQLSRNLYRGRREAFGFDALALAAAQHSRRTGFDVQLTAMQRWFQYLPFMHSEALADQAESVALFDELAGVDARVDDREHARRYHETIRRFGRFPHRNALYGRVSTPAEAAFLTLEAGKEG